jgi:hypothetical protein
MTPGHFGEAACQGLQEEHRQVLSRLLLRLSREDIILLTPKQLLSKLWK